MKIWLLAFFSMVFGGLFGLGSVWLEFRNLQNQFEPHNHAFTAEEKQQDLDAAARVLVVGGTEHNFGKALRESKMSYAFVFKNEGDSPLTLEAGATTCKCTLSALQNGSVAPGETSEVKLEWKVKTVDDEFRQTAEIHTNDPRQPTIRLSIYGRVADSVRLSPRDLALSSISVGEPYPAEFRIYSYFADVLKVTEQTWQSDEHLDHFQVNFRPLTPEEVQEEPNAVGGLMGELTILPGLPLGAIRQGLEIVTDAPDAAPLTLPISGRAVSDITIVGSRFRESSHSLNLGKVARDKGVSSTLRILVKGPHRESAELKIGKITPSSYLQAEFGEVRKLSKGAVHMHTLKIRVPPGLEPINRLGANKTEPGKVVIETTHPVAKQIEIAVNFAVE